MIPIQLFGALVALTAIYLTHLYRKRASFTKPEFLFWLFIWTTFLVVTVFPRIVQPIVGYLGLQRPMDLVMITAFILLYGITFHNYIITHRQEKRLEKLVRELALKDPA